LVGEAAGREFKVGEALGQRHHGITVSRIGRAESDGHGQTYNDPVTPCGFGFSSVS
jgi:hypothetical protein